MAQRQCPDPASFSPGFGFQAQVADDMPHDEIDCNAPGNDAGGAQIEPVEPVSLSSKASTTARPPAVATGEDDDSDYNPPTHIDANVRDDEDVPPKKRPRLVVKKPVPTGTQGPSTREPATSAEKRSEVEVQRTTGSDAPRNKAGSLSRSVIACPNESEPASKSLLASSLERISAERVSKEMTAIWGGVQDTTWKILKSTNVNPDQRAVWVPQAYEELISIYQRQFGEDWKARAQEVTKTGELNNKDALEACLAAAIYDRAFRKSLPWPGPRDLVEKNREEEVWINEVLDDSSGRLNLATIL